MREGLCRICTSPLVFGITPAYAGRTSHQQTESLQSGDHPRLCGKDRRNTDQTLLTLGSPPLMREGRLQMGLWGYAKTIPGSPPLMREGPFSSETLTYNAGITPAYAGRTKSFFCIAELIWDHPRLCGKDFILIIYSSETSGITPAYAGRTTSSIRS